MRQFKISKSITSKDSKSLDHYLKEINRIKLLSADKEIELAKKANAGDKHALTQIVNANLRFVVSVAKQYQNQGLLLDDLINEGNLGLIKAAEKFDETKGFRFISYAVWWIRQAIAQAIADNARMMRLPQNKVNDLTKIKKARISMEQKLGREPSTEELALYLHMKRRDIDQTLTIAKSHYSLDMPLVGEEEMTLKEIIEDKSINALDETIDFKEALKFQLLRCFTVLGNTEQHVVKSFYGIGTSYSMALEDIAESLNLSTERIRQIKERAIRKIRHSSRSKELRAYMA